MILSKCGIEKRLNYNVGDNKSRVQMSAEKEKAIMEAFRHFNMI
ncbi:putative RNA methyltransferase [Lachnospiraceae bacterium]|nr:putative RNA methyltransferase [Lachnospiraceae bacterium]